MLGGLFMKSVSDAHFTALSRTGYHQKSLILFDPSWSQRYVFGNAGALELSAAICTILGDYGKLFLRVSYLNNEECP